MYTKIKWVTDSLYSLVYRGSAEKNGREADEKLGTAWSRISFSYAVTSSLVTLLWFGVGVLQPGASPVIAALCAATSFVSWELLLRLVPVSGLAAGNLGVGALLYNAELEAPFMLFLENLTGTGFLGAPIHVGLVVLKLFVMLLAAELMAFHTSTVITFEARWGSQFFRKVHYAVAKWSAAVGTFAFQLTPSFLIHLIGFFMTVVEELSLVFAVPRLLSLTATLKSSGENMLKPLQEFKSVKDIKNVIILVHGNRFNEAQYLVGKMLLEGRKLEKSSNIFENTTYLTVNYFTGDMMRNHTENTNTIEKCAKIVVSQIDKQMEEIGINRQNVNVVLVGHSLGGLVSAHINEFLAADADLKIVKVIAIASPFAGAFPLRAKKYSSLESYLKKELTRTPLFIELLPDSPALALLRKHMELNKEHYCMLLGGMDVFVRSNSGLLDFLPARNLFYFPHLGHHNIKMSWMMWFKVFSWLEETFDGLKEQKIETK